MGLKAKLRIDKKCNKCGIILPFRAFRKRNDNQGLDDMKKILSFYSKYEK